MVIHTMQNENTAEARQCALPEQTLVYGVLGQLKRTAMEYTAAALNASNMDIRRSFERLANETLRAHEQLVWIMSQNQMYEGSPAAPVHEVQKQAQRCNDTLRSVQLFMREYLHDDATTEESRQAGAAGMAVRNVPQYEAAQTAGRYSMPAAAQPGTRYGFGGGGRIGMGATGAGVGAGPYAMNQRPPAFASYAPALQPPPPFHSVQPPRNEPSGSGIAGSGNFAAGYGQSGAPRLPEFALPHSSQFGGLQQGHYAQIQSSYTAAGIPDQHPYSMAGETMNQSGSSGYGQQSGAAPVGGSGVPGVQGVQGVHPSPVKPEEAPRHVSERGAQKATAAAAATSANAAPAAQGEATAQAATPPSTAPSSTTSSSTAPSALSVAEDIGASAPATKRGRRSKTAKAAGAAGGDTGAAAEASYG